MKAICLGLVWVLTVCLPIGAVIHTIDVSGLAGCEDGMDSVCYDHAPVAYIGYFDWFGMGIYSYEGTKVCFDISTLAGCTVSEIYFTYDGIGNPGGYGFAQDNGPVIIKSYDPGTCQPVCGTYFNPCSNCPDGSVYVMDTVAGGTGNVIQIADDVMDPAVVDLQAAIDNGDPCFCLCMTWDGIISYEVALSGLHLDVEADCGATPTPTITPTPTVTPSPTVTFTPTIPPTPTATDTPAATSTPAPLPATGPVGTGLLLLIIGILTGVMTFRKR